MLWSYFNLGRPNGHATNEPLCSQATVIQSIESARGYGQWPVTYFPRLASYTLTAAQFSQCRKSRDTRHKPTLVSHWHVRVTNYAVGGVSIVSVPGGDFSLTDCYE